MAGIVQPQRKDQFGSTLGKVGQIVSFINPAVGGAIGAVGGVANSLQKDNQASINQGQNDAMKRRMEILQSNQKQIFDDANNALAELPPEQRKIFEPTIREAQYRYSQKGIA